jgi:hypothetical protein
LRRKDTTVHQDHRLDIACGAHRRADEASGAHSDIAIRELTLCTCRRSWPLSLARRISVPAGLVNG